MTEAFNIADFSAQMIVGDDDLVELLGAYQFLQGQNLQVASMLTTTLGIGPTDLRVVLFLFRYTQATPGEIASDLDMSSGAITALLDRLEHAGYVARHAHPSDRRSRVLRLTASGTEIVTQVHEVYRDAFSGLFTGPQIREVAQSLRTLGLALQAQTPNQP